MTIADPAAPTPAPADPDGDLGSQSTLKSRVYLRSSKTTATLNRFFARVQTQLQRLADREGDIAMEHTLDMNGHRITDVAYANQLLSLVPKAQALEELGVNDL